MAPDIKDVANDFKKNDPVEVLKYFTDKMTFTTGPAELSAGQKAGVDIIIMDVREKTDYEKAHVPGAISLPKDDWESLRGLQRDKLHVIYCYSHVCHLGGRACVYFAGKGYSVMEMDGGFEAWEENKLPVEGVNNREAAA